MKKKSPIITVLLFLSIIGILSSGIALYFVLGTNQSVLGSLTSYGSCGEVLAKYTNGANQGQCFVYTLNNYAQVNYVSSVVQKTNSNGDVSCAVSTSSQVSSCTYAIQSDGTQVQVCSSDSQCPSQRCVNKMCKAGLTRTCNIGDRTCTSGSNYVECLASGIWSGTLQCGSAENPSSCSNNQCVSTGCTVNTDKCNGTELLHCQIGGNWVSQGQSSQCGFVACTTDSNCPSGDQCVSGTCVIVPVIKISYPNCSKSADCKVGENCVSGICTKVDATKANAEITNQTIVDSNECRDGTTLCSDGSCKASCGTTPNPINPPKTIPLTLYIVFGGSVLLLIIALILLIL